MGKIENMTALSVMGGLLMAGTLSTEVSAFEITMGTVDADYQTLRLREEPSTNSRILYEMPHDARVEVIGEQQDWYKVKYNGLTGYSYKPYINLDSNISNKTGRVNTSVLNVRKTPSTQYTEIGTLRKGETVNILGQEGVWYKISYQNGQAYVHSDYIDVVASLPSTPSSDNSSNNEQLNINGRIVSDIGMRLRESPDLNATIIGAIPYNTEIKLLYRKNGFFYVNYNGLNGYVKEGSDYVEIIDEYIPDTPSSSEINKKGIVNVFEGLNLRSSMSTASSSNIMMVMPQGQQLTVLKEEGIFYYVEVNGIKGYAAKDYIDFIQSTDNLESKIKLGQAIVENAKQYIGSKYAWGGSNPPVKNDDGTWADPIANGWYIDGYMTYHNGFDCSGLVQYVFAEFGISLPRVTQDQQDVGELVASREDLIPGDLIFWTYPGQKAHHIGIYIGNNQFLHSPEIGDVIKISSLGNYSFAKRVI